MNNTVLIACASAELTATLTRRCRDIHLNVEYANDAMTALEKAVDSSLDVIIIDAGMTCVNGQGVCDMMANHASFRTIPLIVLTENINDVALQGDQLRTHFVPKSPELWSRVEPVLQDLIDLKQALASPGHFGTKVAPDVHKDQKPINLIDAIFAVLGVETGDCLFGDDPSDGKKLSNQPWILSIDDDDDIALALRLRLTEFGAQVMRAADGMSGYRRAFMEVPRAIILDYELPQYNGDHVLRRLKESPVTRNIPVIVLTGHKEIGIERKMWELGASEFLTKPLDWNRLRSALQVFLDVDYPTKANAARQLAVGTSS